MNREFSGVFCKFEKLKCMKKVSGEKKKASSRHARLTKWLWRKRFRKKNHKRNLDSGLWSSTFKKVWTAHVKPGWWEGDAS